MKGAQLVSLRQIMKVEKLIVLSNIDPSMQRRALADACWSLKVITQKVYSSAYNIIVINTAILPSSYAVKFELDKLNNKEWIQEMFNPPVFPS